MDESPPEVRISRARRIAFLAWVGVVSATVGIMFFGLTSLVLGWFEAEDGPAIPVTDLGYGALVGILITGGLLVQFRASDRKIAGVQQAALGSIALLISAALASDALNVAPGLIILTAVAVVIALHPARREFFPLGNRVSPTLAAIAILGAVPFVTYALSMAAQARELVAPPHHIQRLATMAAMAIAVVLTALLAALQTRGWRIPAWCAGMAAIVFGLASIVFPAYWGSAGREWGASAMVWGFVLIVVAERQAWRQRPDRPSETPLAFDAPHSPDHTRRMADVSFLPSPALWVILAILLLGSAASWLWVRRSRRSRGPSARPAVFSLLGDVTETALPSGWSDEQITVIVGDVRMDLRNRPPDEGAVLRVFHLIGDVRLRVSPGTRVITTGSTLLGDQRVGVAPGEGPEFEVRSWGLIGDLEVTD